LVLGIIDGTGSIGAAIGQVILPFIQARAGWKWVFYSFMIEVRKKSETWFCGEVSAATRTCNLISVNVIHIKIYKNFEYSKD